MGTTETQGRDWLDMRPGHFDTRLLPRKHRKADPDALWTVADLYPPETPAAAPLQADGQADLFSGLGE